MSNPPIEFLSGKEESRKTIINHASMALHTFAISAPSSSPCEIRNFSLEMHRMMQQGKQINWLLKYHRIEFRLISNQNWYIVSWVKTLTWRQQFVVEENETKTTSSVSLTTHIATLKFVNFRVHQQKNVIWGLDRDQNENSFRQFVDNPIANKKPNCGSTHFQHTQLKYPIIGHKTPN